MSHIEPSETSPLLFPVKDTSRHYIRTPSPKKRQESISDEKHAQIVAEPEEGGVNAAKIAWLCALSLFSDMLAYGAAIPIMPLFLESVADVGEAGSGLIFSCHAVGLLAMSPLVARLCSTATDLQSRRKRLLVFGHLCLVMSCLIFAVLPHLLVARGMSTGLVLATFVVARIIHGIQSAITWSLTLALIADFYSEGEHTSHARMTARVLFANTVGFIAGQLIAGFLWEWAGKNGKQRVQHNGLFAPFVICAIVSLVSSLAWSFVTIPSMEEQVETLVNTPRPRSFSDSLRQDTQSTLFDNLEAQMTRRSRSQPTTRNRPTVLRPLRRRWSLLHGAHVAGRPESTYGNRNLEQVANATEFTLNSDFDESTPVLVESSPLLTPPMPSKVNMLSPRMIILLLGVFACSMIFNGVDPVLPLHLRSVYHLPAQFTAYCFVAMECGNGISRFVVGWLSDKFPDKRWTILTLGLFGVACSAFTMASNLGLWSVILGLVILGIAESAFTTPVYSELASFVVDSLDQPRGRRRPSDESISAGSEFSSVYAMWSAVNSLGTLLGPTVAGLLMSWTSFSHTMIGFAGFAGLCSAFLIIAGLKHVKS